jgi:hypothetical protein
MGLGQRVKGANSVTPEAVNLTNSAEPVAPVRAAQDATSKKLGRKTRSVTPAAAKRAPKGSAAAESASKSALPSTSEKSARKRLSIKVARDDSKQTADALKQEISGS